MKDIKSKQGFSLVELSLVLIIIGLLIAGVTAGKTLVNQSRISKAVNQIGGYSTGVRSFFSQYGSIPGDFNTATSYWTGSINGNGDGKLEWATDGAYLWGHLKEAGLLATAVTAVTVNDQEQITVGTDVPALAIKGLGIGAVYCDAGAAASVSIVKCSESASALSIKNDNYFLLGGSGATAGTTGYNGTLALTTETSFGIDQKIDDGRPLVGEVLTFNNACIQLPGVDPATEANKSGVAYKLSTPGKVCNILIRIGSF